MSLDFREFRGRFQPILTQSGLVLAHSAKGSSWEDHKYIKRIDGTYYYPNNYEGGRHIDSAPDANDKTNSSSKIDLDSDDVEKLANEVIRGNFGNGQTRKDLLGENYAEVQKRVNELMKKSSLASKEVTGTEAKSDKVMKALEKIGNMGYNVADITEKYKKK